MKIKKRFSAALLHAVVRRHSRHSVCASSSVGAVCYPMKPYNNNNNSGRHVRSSIVKGLRCRRSVTDATAPAHEIAAKKSENRDITKSFILLVRLVLVAPSFDYYDNNIKHTHARAGNFRPSKSK